MSWLASAPANIALIKYMGKEDRGTNTPINPSLSYTLEHLITVVELTPCEGREDCWSPLTTANYKGRTLIPPTLSEKGKERFLAHLNRLKKLYGFEGSFNVSSSNNFPMDAGLASSASSFAALTKAANLALSELCGENRLNSPLKLAQMSQKGSGSSCRSFFGPFALWDKNEVQAITLPYSTLSSVVVIAEEKKKEISSSQAHQLIKSSPHYKRRGSQASKHLEQLLTALKQKDWQAAYRITWQEFSEMHELFHTSTPSFSYINEHSEAILKLCETFWLEQQSGPLVTMDAGANVHLLFRNEDKTLQERFLKDYIKDQYRVIV